MTSELFTRLMQEFSILSGLLLAGFFLRAKIKLFQNLFLPASVIGGFLGLLLGPVVLKTHAVLPIPDEFIKDFALIPGILILPIIASVPLGLGLDPMQTPLDKKQKSQVLPMFLLSVGCAFGLFALGFATKMVFSRIMPELEIYPAFGMELALGFFGGHGTAGLIGNILQKLNQPAWEVAQGVAVTSATVGLVFGILFGMIFINIAARKNKISNLTDPKDLPEEMRKGYQQRLDEQTAVCRETTHSSSVDSLALHVAIILGVCGASYVLVAFLKAHHVPLLSNIAEWAYAIALMLIVNNIIKRLDLGFLIDGRIKTKFASLLVDYSIVAAIASLPVSAVLRYAVPMIAMFALGLLMVYLIIMVLGIRLFKDYEFERSIALFGQSTGVIMTGILLLRICDSNLSTPVLKDFSISYALATLVCYALLLPVIKLLPNSFAIFCLTGGVCAACVVGAVIYSRLKLRKE
ncbi:glutamate:Na+ symporter, ESS family [Desulfatibacillum alkenivorans DSM 16219]|uniref:Glutamate:Na+ symporter, ESS family n=1 Tax=Desulfatibacillum alkenivorans DSM 16219 TaxID=1121393 RepID=A0A1M6ZYE5_9BACT|nr:sodium/glutamate symporter [Desulfatibacillum alkenivorans]SHL35365.1 glutamate:Na+ symporter, ESS family [Desulfatibacillum alkenivorans DSM 16219]